MSRTKETDWNGVWEVFWRSFVYFPFTKDDLNAFNRYHHRHSPTARRQYLRSWFIPALIWLLVCTGIWYLGVRERGTPLRTFLDLLPLFSGVPMYLLCFPWIYRRSLRKTVAGMISEGKNRSLFSRRRLTISPEGITDSDEFGQTSIAWHAMERIVAGDERAYLYTNALAAIIVPRRAFAETQQFDEFVETARAMTTWRELRPHPFLTWSKSTHY